MLGAIKLDDESALKAHEIHDVAVDGMLPSELEASESTIPQVLPDQLLSIGGALPQPAGESGPALLRHPHPSPLPTKGEGELRERTSSLSYPLPLGERERVRAVLSEQLLGRFATDFRLTGLPPHPRFALPLLCEERVGVKRTLDH
jgi:hypothetical protein